MSMDNGGTPATPAEKSATPSPAADLVKALTALADGQRAINERLEKIEAARPTITQTSEQAQAGQEAVLRDRREQADKAADKEGALLTVKQMQELLAQRDAEHKAEMEEIRKSVDFRRSSYSLGEMSEQIAEKAGICKDATKVFYSKLVGKALRGQEWSKAFGDLRPADVLIRGAWEARPISIPYGGGHFSTIAMAPMTAGADDEVLREAQDASDVLYTWMLWKQARNEPFLGWEQSPFFPRFKHAIEALQRALPGGEKAAMTAGSLANWVPTGFSAKLIERVELDRVLTRYIPFHQMSQNPEIIFARGSYMSMYKVTATTSNPEDATGITTSAVNPLQTTLTLHDIAIRAVFNIAAEEDTVPSLVPALIDDMGRTWAYGLEDAILNSDSTNFPHQDVDITATDDYRKTWDGLRVMAIDNSYTTDISSPTDTKIISTAVAQMGKYGARPLRRIAICSPGVRANLKTLKTAGNDPVIIGNASPGPIPSAIGGINMEQLDGSPLVTVESARDNLNASGFYDGTTATAGTFLWVYPEGFVLAAKNQVGRTGTQFHSKTGQTDLVLYQRYEFEDVLPIATHHTIELGVGLVV